MGADPQSTARSPQRGCLDQFRARFGAAPQLAAVRAQLRRWLIEAGVGAVIADEALVATGEACSNAIEHAYRDDDATTRAPAVVEVLAHIAAGSLEILVADAGAWKVPPVDPGQRGRGTMLMHRLMDDVVTHTGPGGTSVRMRRELLDRGRG
jgi:anti-sigma regulatory factor (Ser/Thr protein kinase)